MDHSTIGKNMFNDSNKTNSFVMDVKEPTIDIVIEPMLIDVNARNKAFMGMTGVKTVDAKIDLVPKVLVVKKQTTEKPRSEYKKIIIGSSRITELKNARSQAFRNTKTPNARTAIFEKIQDKSAIAKSLECTKECKNVTTRSATGDFGVCTRRFCSFSHSKLEHRPRMCEFDQMCKFSDTCKFCHSYETPTHWRERTGNNEPDLPETSEKSRIPFVTNEVTPVAIPVVSETVKDLDLELDNMSIDIIPSLLPETEKNSNKIRRRKNTHSNSPNHKRHKTSDRSRSPIRQTIHVPTEELARFVTTKALERGADVRVIVD